MPEYYTNEAGELLGVDYPSDNPADYYCHDCGFSHAKACAWGEEEEPEADEAWGEDAGFEDALFGDC